MKRKKNTHVQIPTPTQDLCILPINYTVFFFFLPPICSIHSIDSMSGPLGFPARQDLYIYLLIYGSCLFLAFPYHSLITFHIASSQPLSCISCALTSTDFDYYPHSFFFAFHLHLTFYHLPILIILLVSTNV